MNSFRKMLDVMEEFIMNTEAERMEDEKEPAN